MPFACLPVSHKDPCWAHSGVDIHIYADDTVLYVHGSTKTQDAAKLINSMVNVTAWLNLCCLQLIVSKTMGMFFIKTNGSSVNSDVFGSGEKLQVIKSF